MRYALTGDSGMLGSVLAEKMISRGWKRVVPPPTVANWISPSTGLTEPDFRSEDYLSWLEQAEIDVFIHAGALVGTTRCETCKRDVWTCNADGPLRLAEVARRADFRFVYFASEAEFDPDAYDRDHPLRIVTCRRDPRTYYGVSKLAGRLLVEREVAPNKLLVIYPCFGFGGMRDGTSCVAELLKCASGAYARRPILPLDPRAFKEVTPHDFIAEITIRAIEREWAGFIPAASGLWIPYADVVDAVREVAGVDLDPDWRTDYDYKGDLVYDPADVRSVHESLGLDFTWEDLLEALRTEWKALRSEYAVFGTHDWSHLDALRA